MSTLGVIQTLPVLAAPTAMLTSGAAEKASDGWEIGQAEPVESRVHPLAAALMQGATAFQKLTRGSDRLPRLNRTPAISRSVFKPPAKTRWRTPAARVSEATDILAPFADTLRMISMELAAFEPVTGSLNRHPINGESAAKDLHRRLHRLTPLEAGPAEKGSEEPRSAELNRLRDLKIDLTVLRAWLLSGGNGVTRPTVMRLFHSKTLRALAKRKPISVQPLLNLLKVILNYQDRPPRKGVTALHSLRR